VLVVRVKRCFFCLASNPSRPGPEPETWPGLWGHSSGGLGRLASWHLPGWLDGLMSRRAIMSNVEVAQTTCLLMGTGQGKKDKRRKQAKSHTRGGGEGGKLGVVPGYLWRDPPSSYACHCWWGRSAYLARAGMKSPSVSGSGMGLAYNWPGPGTRPGWILSTTRFFAPTCGNISPAVWLHCSVCVCREKVAAICVGCVLGDSPLTSI